MEYPLTGISKYMMKPTTYNECIETNNVHIRQENRAKAISLRKTAQARQEFLNQTITAKNANFIFEGLYSCLLEILHAHLIEQGIHIENHICIGYYLRDELNKQKFYREFDTCRYKRNGLVYYGEQMPEKTARKSIQTLQQLITQATQLIS